MMMMVVVISKRRQLDSKRQETPAVSPTPVGLSLDSFQFYDFIDLHRTTLLMGDEEVHPSSLN